MTRFAPLTPDTADADAREILEAVQAEYGFVPNLLGNLAHSPVTAKGYLALGQLFAESGFDTTEQQIILLTVSRYHRCEYCVGAHSALSAMHKVPAEVVAAIRAGEPIPEQKLEALRVFTAKVVDQRGWLSDTDVAAFLSAGYDPEQMLEVVLGVAMKTISNYANHIAGTNLDTAFGNFAWQAPDAAAA